MADGNRDVCISNLYYFPLYLPKLVYVIIKEKVHLVQL